MSDTKKLRELAEAVDRNNFDSVASYVNAVGPKVIIELIDRLEKTKAELAEVIEEIRCTRMEEHE